MIESAVQTYNEIVRSSARAKRLTTILNAWNQLGNCFIKQGKQSQALESYLKADEFIVSKKIEVESDVRSKLYLNIGKLYMQKYFPIPTTPRKKYEEAVEYIEKSRGLRVKDEGENSLSAVSCYEALGYLQPNQ